MFLALLSIDLMYYTIISNSNTIQYYKTSTYLRCNANSSIIIYLSLKISVCKTYCCPQQCHLLPPLDYRGNRLSAVEPVDLSVTVDEQLTGPLNPPGQDLPAPSEKFGLLLLSAIPSTTLVAVAVHSSTVCVYCTRISIMNYK